MNYGRHESAGTFIGAALNLSCEAARREYIISGASGLRSLSTNDNLLAP